MGGEIVTDEHVMEQRLSDGGFSAEQSSTLAPLLAHMATKKDLELLKKELEKKILLYQLMGVGATTALVSAVFGAILHFMG